MKGSDPMNPFAWIALLLVGAGSLVIARLWWRNWGALPPESLVLPGDELIPEPAGVGF